MSTTITIKIETAINDTLFAVKNLKYDIDYPEVPEFHAQLRTDVNGSVTLKIEDAAAFYDMIRPKNRARVRLTRAMMYVVKRFKATRLSIPVHGKLSEFVIRRRSYRRNELWLEEIEK